MPSFYAHCACFPLFYVCNVLLEAQAFFFHLLFFFKADMRTFPVFVFSVNNVKANSMCNFLFFFPCLFNIGWWSDA